YSGSIPNGVPSAYVYTGPEEGYYQWYVTCQDDAGNSDTSETWQFLIDLGGTDDPEGDDINVTLLDPANDSAWNTPTLNLRWLVTDDFDSQLDCRLYVKEPSAGSFSEEYSGSIPNGVPSAYVYTGPEEGYYQWYVTCQDDAGNSDTSETWLFAIDTTAPAVSLVSPPNGSTLSTGAASLTWYVEDNLDDVLQCDVFFEGALYATNIATPSGTQNSVGVAGLADGTYNWSVSCVDEAGNWAFSQVWRFTVRHTDQPGGLSVSAEAFCPETIRVRVTSDKSGGGLEGATVAVYQGTTYIGEATTDERGYATFVLNPGIYKINADKASYGFDSTQISFSCPAMPLSVSQECSDETTVKFTINTVPGAEVSVFEGQKEIFSTVDSDGKVTMLVSENKNYYITATHQNYAPAEASIRAQDCRLTLPSLDLTVSYSCEHNGVAYVSFEQEPISSATVRIYLGDKQVGTGYTNAEGMYYFSLGKGLYQITASKEGYSTDATYLSVPECPENQSKNQTEDQNQTEGNQSQITNVILNLTIDKNETFIDDNVTVTTTVDNNPAPLTIEIIDPDGKRSRVTTSENGRYILKVEKTGYYEFKIGDKSYAVLLAKESTKGSLLDMIVDLGAKSFLLLLFIIALLFVFFWLKRKKRKDGD
ncbi:MAG: hypothetical protein QW035_00205, partial [Candidatus Anstonellales archaeon]